MKTAYEILQQQREAISKALTQARKKKDYSIEKLMFSIRLVDSAIQHFYPEKVINV